MMKAERITIETFIGSANDEKQRILKEIEKGAVFVYPTETIYGIGGLTVGEFVFKRVLAVKKRPPKNPFIQVASKRDCILSLKPRFSSKAELLASRFWPGPLTMVLYCESSGIETAIRITDHPFIVEVNSCFDLPLISTSANISGESYDADPDHIFGLFSDSVDFMFDAGWLPPSKPSTVVKAVNSSIEIIRSGAISEELILSCLSEK
ncbi:MAG TPA: L-threonylcarbamoyladenylate synthase [Chitinispirillaceae bacterium]|nr:L-threonylcarbamoyladenylate synthase [Chitinispirillaceae bacterium]